MTYTIINLLPDQFFQSRQLLTAIPITAEIIESLPPPRLEMQPPRCKNPATRRQYVKPFKWFKFNRARKATAK